MTVPRPIATPASDMQPVSDDLIVAKACERPRGVNGGALAHLAVRAAESKADGRLAALLDGIGDAFYSLDGDWRFTSVNRAAQEHFGIPIGEMLGRVIWDVVPGSEGTELRRRYEDALGAGAAASFEARSVIAPDRTLEFRVFPYDGGIAVSFRDRTERCRAEDYLKESQAQLSALADHLPLGMVYQMSDADNFFNRRFIYVSASCERLNGIPAERALEDPSALYDLLLPEFREPVFRTQAESHVTGEPFDMEVVIRHGATGEPRWQRIVATRRALPDGRAVWDGLQIDITDHKQSEEHLRLLIHELNHRVKNTLATVQSLAAQSFGRLAAHADDEVRAARRAFEARLIALARGHDVLTRENWEGALLSDVVSEACAPYGAVGAMEGGRVGIEGPDLRIAPPMALSLSMTLHELFTNALKFGALSRPSGRIRIGWSVLTDSAGSRLRMRWEERGGPPVGPPSRMGFGSRLIQAGLARELNGSAHIAYEPAGVVCTIDVPVS